MLNTELVSEFLKEKNLYPINDGEDGIEITSQGKRFILKASSDDLIELADLLVSLALSGKNEGQHWHIDNFNKLSPSPDCDELIIMKQEHPKKTREPAKQEKEDGCSTVLKDNINARNNSFMYYLHERDTFNEDKFKEFLYGLSHVTLYDIETYMGLEYVIRQIWRHISCHFNPNDSFEITDLPENYIRYIEWLEMEVTVYKNYIKHYLGNTLNEQY